MEYEIVIFWFVVLSCVSGLLAVVIRLRSPFSDWTVLYVGILAVSMIGRFWPKTRFIDVAFGLWLLLVLLPALLSRVYYQALLQQRYSKAERVARVIGWLHPIGVWKQQAKIARAFRLAQQGDLRTATETLSQFGGTDSLVGLVAITNLYRITNQWEQLLEWQDRHHLRLERYPQLLPVLLRAQAETGDLHGMVELYERNQREITRLVPPASRDLCRLVLFAFCGERELVERLFSGNLSLLPQEIREFWIATAEWSAGLVESAKRRLEQLLPAGDALVRFAVERRLSQISTPFQPPEAFARRVIAEAVREHGHDESYGADASFFSKRARATQLLVALNLLMFGVEMYFGSSTSPNTLFRLGALFAPAVKEGQWWRLITSLFLHLGSLHLAMNMFALWLLGPFTEFALGFWRYLVVYLLAGVGSMGAVILFASRHQSEQLTLGASGCVMGLVGATGALMLRGWFREKATSARRRLISMVVIVVTQTTFDLLIPQVSMTAHLSGAVIGFAATMIFRDRLGSGTD